jgi:hypothetical protein
MVFIPAEDDDGEGAMNRPAKVSDAFDQSSPDIPDVTPTDLGVCKKCGAANKVGKTGSIYCGNMCWLNK